MLSFNFVSIITLLFTLSSNVFATRTPQYCRHRGDNGNAEICLAINTFYNTTTDGLDIYMTLQTFRYKASKKGWAAMGLGNQMTGALMFLIYGDPELGDMTTSVRTATGHHPVGMITDTSFYDGPIPEIQIVDSKFEAYTGEYINEALGFGPSHVGTAHIVCYDCKQWTGQEIANTSTMANMIWATNWGQDLQGDYGYERQIEAHKMGLGFGPLWVDLLNAQITADTAHFPIMNYAFKDKGLSEIGLESGPPTDEDIDYEEVPVVSVPEASKEEEETATAPESPIASYEPETETTTQTEAEAEAVTSETETSTTDSDPAPSQPASTLLGKTIRDWMWHLHGLLMCLSFLFLYPLGASLIRTSDPRAFNFHWTTQAFASLLVVVGAIVGYWQSSGISVAHQYLGIGIVVAIAAQIFLGWRHHVEYLKVQRKTGLIRIHVWLGRSIFVAGLVNIVMGLLLRRYTQWVIFVTCAFILLEVVGMLYVLGRGEILKLAKIPGGKGKARNVYGGGAEVGMTAREAEEYFQLTGGEDDEDGLSEDGGNEEGMTKAEEKRDQERRLAKLDRV
jgi:hypothetical protein